MSQQNRRSVPDRALLGDRRSQDAFTSSPARIGPSDSDEPRTVELETSAVIDGLVEVAPDPEPPVPREFQTPTIEAVIIEAPASVAADEEFTFVVEIRNGSMEPVDLSPCPWFFSSFGESGTASFVFGPWPCDELGTIGSGGRVRLRIPMTAPSEATAGEGGQWATLDWRTGTVAADVPLPMEDV